MRTERSCAVDALRLVLAVLVLVLHLNLFAGSAPLVSYFLCQVLARLAVPFFAAVSGYFLGQAPAEQLRRKRAQLLAGYLVWMAVLLPLSVPVRQNPVWDVLEKLLLTGCFQLWYVLAMVWLLTGLLLLRRLRLHLPGWLMLALLALGIARSAYGALLLRAGIRLPDYRTVDMLLEVLPFFWLGMQLRRGLPGWAERRLPLLVPLSLLCLTAEVFLVVRLGLKRNVILCLSTAPAVLSLLAAALHCPWKGDPQLGKRLSSMAETVFYGHYALSFALGWLRISAEWQFPIILAILLPIGWLKSRLIWKA